MLFMKDGLECRYVALKTTDFFPLRTKHRRWLFLTISAIKNNTWAVNLRHNCDIRYTHCDVILKYLYRSSFLSILKIREYKKSRFPVPKKLHGTFISEGIIDIMGNNYVIQNRYFKQGSRIFEFLGDFHICFTWSSPARRMIVAQSKLTISNK